MFSSREAFENDFCPVREELLGELYRANQNGLPQLVESVSSEVRAMLALFCYRRSHLYSLALSIAASCNERELIQLGGRVGSTLYALSREAPTTRSAPSSSYGNRKPITLSTKPLSTFSPIEDEFDEDFAQARHGVTRPVRAIPAPAGRAVFAPFRTRHRRACRFGRRRAALGKSRTTSPRRPCPTEPSTDSRRSAFPTVSR